jgi:hypothetical protein
MQLWLFSRVCLPLIGFTQKEQTAMLHWVQKNVNGSLMCSLHNKGGGGLSFWEYFVCEENNFKEWILLLQSSHKSAAHWTQKTVAGFFSHCAHVTKIKISKHWNYILE